MTRVAVPAPTIWLRTLAADEPERVGSGARAGVTAGAKGPALLTVRRTSNGDVQDRQVHLLVDGEDWVTIYYGQEVTREMAPGRHTLKANNTLVRRSVEFDARLGEHVRFQCVNRAHWTSMLFMAFLGAAILTVHLNRESGE